MNAFEQIVAKLLNQEGYWTRIGYRVNLTKAEKREIGKHSMARPEIDILAYRPVENEILWVECKSYLDSRGVVAQAIMDINHRYAGRYKLFTQHKFRQVTSEALVAQLVERKLVLPNPDLRYCLIAGKMATEGDREQLAAFFNQQGGLFYDEHWVKTRLELFANRAYEDDEAMIVAKLFSRVDSNG